MTEVAAQVGLSLSACHRRVRELESTGAIAGYRATVSPDAAGLGFEAVIFAVLVRSDPDTLREFETALVALPGFVSADRLFGEPDYIIHLRTRDLASYQQLFDAELGALPGVQRLSSTMVMKRLGVEGQVPL